MGEELLDEVLLGDARGARKKAIPLAIGGTRSLGEADLDALLSGEATPAPRNPIAMIRHSHHQLARLLAEGTPQHEVSAITGYSPAYISVLKDDPAFCELLQFYSAQREAIFVDVAERMKALGLSTLDELQRRLAEDPEAWKVRELMELAQMTLQGGAAGKAGPAAAAAPVALNISFISPQTSGPTPMVDITPSDGGVAG